VVGGQPGRPLHPVRALPYELNAWRETPFYNERERAALLWTEELTLISQGDAPDAVYEEVSQHFSEEELVNLTLTIVAINGWNRLTIGFRFTWGCTKFIRDI
jgi:alkylhydroperoxidase family enzyme